jgi:hypothetical protein
MGYHWSRAFCGNEAEVRKWLDKAAESDAFEELSVEVVKA